MSENGNIKRERWREREKHKRNKEKRKLRKKIVDMEIIEKGIECFVGRCFRHFICIIRWKLSPMFRKQILITGWKTVKN